MEEQEIKAKRKAYLQEYLKRPDVILRRRNGIVKYHFTRRLPVWNKGISGYTTSWKGKKMSEESKTKMKAKWTTERKQRLMYGERNPRPTNWIKEGHPRWNGGRQMADRRTGAKRREYGFNELNNIFENSHAHHIDRNNVIYIPKVLHRSIFHSLNRPNTMEKINCKVFCWLLGKPIEELV